MFIKVIELTPVTAATLADRLRKAAVSNQVAQFRDIHGNNYVVCHGTIEGKVKYSTPTTMEHVLSVAYNGAGLLKGETRYRKFFNIVCCHAAMFKEEYETGVDFQSNPKTGAVSPSSTVKGKHIFRDCPVPIGWLTETSVVGNYLVVKTIPPNANYNY